MVTGENINLNDGMMPKKEQYKKNYPVETGKIMREKYENGLMSRLDSRFFFPSSQCFSIFMLMNLLEQEKAGRLP